MHVIWRDASTEFAGECFYRRRVDRIARRQGVDMIDFANRIRVDEICISEELIGRLHHATEESVLDLVAPLRADERASLAMHCYRKSHLRQIGLTIATTCDLNALVQELGSVLGGAIFAQSRKRTEEPNRLWGRQRPAITLACSAGGFYPPPVDVDDLSGCEQGEAV
jgi:hypothetical protein